ncbi:MAG: hypothetical protein K0Q72_4166 [Armatimonadetes bacterium]|nr:hypothetical protein [Armatimonadota bacterium]
MKALLRSYPEALFRLAGYPIDAGRLRMEDTAINVPEQRADHVFVVCDEASRDEGALYLEYQLQPRSELLSTWFAKAGALNRQLGLPVVLLAIYLEKGHRASFPNEYVSTVGRFSNSFRFPTVRLWEHAERIRSGELWPLAPLLVLCEDDPGERTLREEVALINRSGVGSEEQAELLAVALRVASRRLSRSLVEAIFREELPMVRGASIIDDWIAEGEARGEARGKAEGETHGRLAEAQRLTREALAIRFGALPGALAARIEQSDAEACEVLFRRALVATSLDEL